MSGVQGSDAGQYINGGVASESAPLEQREVPFEFTGTAGEYFRIWIVNVLLSIVTLGIYSAWAKVRTKSYFYRHTRLDGSSFEYLADPIKILKGRLIVGTFLAAMYASQHYSPIVYAVLAFALVLLSPLVMAVSLSFNARYSSFRNVRFGFVSTISEAYVTYILAGVIYMFTLGLGLPYAQWRMTRWVIENHRYGKQRFAWTSEWGSYYVAYFIAFLLMAPGFGAMFYIFMSAGSETIGDPEATREALSTAVPLAMGLFYLWLLFVMGFVRARFANLAYGGAQIGFHDLKSDQRGLDLTILYVTNALAVLVSVGLLAPWAMIRLARYRADHTRVLLRGDLVATNPGEDEQWGGPLGDAAVDLGGFDLDLGL